MVVRRFGTTKEKSSKAPHPRFLPVFVPFLVRFVTKIFLLAINKPGMIYYTYVPVKVYLVLQYSATHCCGVLKNNRHIKACRYDEHWGKRIPFPTYSWPVESCLQQGRLRRVRYLPPSSTPAPRALVLSAACSSVPYNVSVKFILGVHSFRLKYILNKCSWQYASRHIITV